MDALWALGSILGILGVVLVGGYVLAVFVNMVGGVFVGSNRSSKKDADILDYSEFKSMNDTYSNENVNTLTSEYDEKKAQEEADKLKDSAEVKNDFKFEDESENDDLDAMEEMLKSKKETATEAPKTVQEQLDEEDDMDIDSLLDGISNDVIEDAKDKLDAEDQQSVKPDSNLDKYNIDEVLEKLSAEEDESDKTADAKEVEPEEKVNDAVEDETDELDEYEDQNDEILIEEESEPESIKNHEPENKNVPSRHVKKFELTFKDYEQEARLKRAEADRAAELKRLEDEKTAEFNRAEAERIAEVEDLKRQVEKLNQMLEQARSSVNTVETEVVIDMTEEECLNRIAVLDERLKNLRKDYKTNLKEYKPLKKVRENLEKYQTKLRRREAVAAKKKVALYGVNNYVDIDKEKAEKLANELELLDGLRLSVQHCEEVIESSKDRFPILENTNNILEEQIANTEADLAELQIKLQKIRERNGK